MTLVRSSLKIAGFAAGAWVSTAALTFAADVVQARRALRGDYGLRVQDEYVSLFEISGAKKLYASKARQCLTRPWTAARSHVLVARFIRDLPARDREQPDEAENEPEWYPSYLPTSL